MSVVNSGFTIAKPSSSANPSAHTVAGSLGTSAVYGYKVTYVTGFGETDPSVNANVTTSSSGSVLLQSIPVSSDGNVTARRLYRTVAGGSTYLLLATIPDNVTSTYVDVIADGNLSTAAPRLNLAHSVQNVDGLLKITKPLQHSIERNITAAPTGTSADAYQLTAAYNWITTVGAANASVKLPCAAPSLIGTAITVRNTTGTNAVRVYPFDGQTINGLAVDTPVTLAVTSSATYVNDTATNWAAI